MDDYITALDSTGLDVHGQKALRDLPKAPGFPEGHEWPAPPAWMGGMPHEA